MAAGDFCMGCRLPLGFFWRHQISTFMSLLEKVLMIICCTDDVTTDPHAVIALFLH
jgi:hypothetical protein